MSEGFSVDDAVAHLTSGPELEAEFLDGAVEATEEEHEISQDDPEPEVDVEEAAEGPSGDDVENDEESEEADEPIPAPEFWEAEHKAEFAKLDRQAQQLISKVAHKGTQAVAKAMNEAALTRKSAEAEAKALADHRAKLDPLLARAEESFKSKYAGYETINWPQALRDNPQQAMIAKAEYEAHLSDLQQLQFAKAEADRSAFQTHQRDQYKALLEVAKSDPTSRVLIDPKEGAGRVGEVVQYLAKQGIPQDNIQLITATEMTLAHKAML